MHLQKLLQKLFVLCFKKFLTFFISPKIIEINCPCVRNNFFNNSHSMFVFPLAWPGKGTYILLGGETKKPQSGVQSAPFGSKGPSLGAKRPLRSEVTSWERSHPLEAKCHLWSEATKSSATARMFCPFRAQKFCVV